MNRVPALLVAAILLLGLAPGPSRPTSGTIPRLPPGWPTTFQLGMSSSPGDAAAMQATAPFAFGKVRFEENRGQTDSTVRYLARARGQQVFFTGTGVVFSPPHGEPIHMGGAPPDLPPVEQCVPRTKMGPVQATLMERLSVSLHPDDASIQSGEPTGAGIVRGWFGFAAPA